MSEIESKIRIFVAGPKDTSEEWKQLDQVIEELNGTWLKRDGIMLQKVTGDTDAPRGPGRPQGLINPLICKCDVYIGFMCGTVGSPTGEEESGTIEEFNLACNLYEERGRPYPHLFFSSNISIESPSIEKVKSLLGRMEFQKELCDSKTFYFHEYGSMAELRGKLRRELYWFVEEQWKKTLKEESQKKGETLFEEGRALEVRPPPAVAFASVGDPKVVCTQATKELLDMTGSEIMRELEDNGSEHRRDPDALKLGLLAAAWLSAYNTGDILSNHALNLFYNRRRDMEITSKARELLLRSFLGNQFGPGWYWFRGYEPLDLISIIYAFAKADQSPEVIRRALDTLRLANAHWSSVMHEETDISDFFESVLMHSSETVRVAAMDLFKELATEADPQFLTEELDLDEKATAEITFAVNARLKPKEALRQVRDGRIELAGDEVSLLKNNLARISTEDLIQGLSGESRALRYLIVEELAVRSEITITLAEGLITDEDARVKAFAAKALIQLNQGVTPAQIGEWFPARKSTSYFDFSIISKNEILEALYRTYEPDRLWEEVDWTTAGVLPYRILCTAHFHSIGHDIRSDMQNLAMRVEEAFRNKYLDAGLAVIPESMNDQQRKEAEKALLTAIDKELGAMKGYKEHCEWVANDYLAVILGALCENGGPADIALAREYIRSPAARIREQATRLIWRFGDESDITQLVSLIRNEDETKSVRLAAGRAALTLAPGITGAAKQLCQTRDPELARLAIHSLADEEPSEVADFLIRCRFPHYEIEEIRLLSVAYFAVNMGDTWIEQYMDEYVRQPGYNYDVVAWFDRILYSPPFLRDKYRDELASRLKSGAEGP